MCESTIWLQYPDGHKEKIAQDVLFIKQEGPMVWFRGLLAGPTEIAGTILEVNAMEHTVTLSVTEMVPRSTLAASEIGKPLLQDP